jgi:hypothetical protein
VLVFSNQSFLQPHVFFQAKVLAQMNVSCNCSCSNYSKKIVHAPTCTHKHRTTMTGPGCRAGSLASWSKSGTQSDHTCRRTVAHTRGWAVPPSLSGRWCYGRSSGAWVLTHGSGRFWPELVLFLASSDNVDIRAEMLKANGEFMM